MSKLFFHMGVSLDGFIAGENRDPKTPSATTDRLFINGCTGKKLSGDTSE